VEIRKLVSRFGFAHYLYGGRILQPSGETLQFIFSGYPDDWMTHYQASQYVLVDPVVLHCFHSNTMTPLVWRESLAQTPEQRAFWEEAQSHGVASGVSVPLRGVRGEVALFSAANPESEADAHAHSIQFVGALYAISAYVHEAIRRLVYQPEIIQVTPPRLTPREVECLTWWAAGKTAWEIGMLLSVSERTVRFHLDNLKAKLKASTKSQAVARAIQLAIIQP
jgi:DNA-binding CsgD family transcriptional regulator